MSTEYSDHPPPAVKHPLPRRALLPVTLLPPVVAVITANCLRKITALWWFASIALVPNRP